MQELAARHRGSRILIVVPASLQDQWKKEMMKHFLRRFFIYNSRKMEGIQELVDENLNPWLAKNSIITSIDWIKPQYEGTGISKRNVNRVFDQLMKVEKRWDLVIIDEAHYASTNSNRSDLAKLLQEKCDSLLLLTATPHSGNPEHFFNLLNLIDPFMFAEPDALDQPDARQRVDKVMIRRGKDTIYETNEKGELVKKFRDREPHAIEISFSDKEKKLYDEVSDYTATGWAQLTRKRKISAAEKNVGKFLLTLVQKRMVSSLFALRETLKNRIGSIVESRAASKFLGHNEKELRKLLKEYDRGEYMDDEDRELVERYIETRKIEAVYADRTTEVNKLRDLLEQVEPLIEKGQDAKLKRLRDFLKGLFAKEPKEKVIIFTEYRDTLRYLHEQLSNEWFLGKDRIVIIHGGMPLGEDEKEPREGTKLHAEQRFNDPDTRILLATDAASEGLNLQRHCHILVNYELPWNPNRLEQRIGRIHRYGQRRIAYIHNLMIKGSKEAEIFKRLQDKIEIIRKQLGNMAEVLGVLDRISLDDLILRVLDKRIDEQETVKIADDEFRHMEEMAESIKKTQFLSGCRQFTREDIDSANQSIEDAQKAIPQHKDVQRYVEIFLRIYGDEGKGDQDGRRLYQTKDKGVYRLNVPSVIQDEKIPVCYHRITFSREVAIKDWPHREEPDFLAFGHPLLERMVHYCRETCVVELKGKLACLIADYAGLPGIIFNFLLRFEDKIGHIIREELEPVFVDQEGTVKHTIGRELYLGPCIPQTQPNQDTINIIRSKAESLQKAAKGFIHTHYLDYHKRVEDERNKEIAILLEDVERFDRGMMEQFEARKKQLIGAQTTFDFAQDAAMKGQRTRLENQIKSHTHRMQERRNEIENMRLGDFPAPELLNMILVIPA